MKIQEIDIAVCYGSMSAQELTNKEDLTEKSCLSGQFWQPSRVECIHLCKQDLLVSWIKKDV